MDEKKQPSEQDILAEIAGPLEALAKLGKRDAVPEAAEAAAETVDAAVETVAAPAEAAAAEAAEAVEAAAAPVEAAAAEAAEAVEAAAEPLEAAAEAAEAAAEPLEAVPESVLPPEELSPEAALVEEIMADRRPAEDLPIEELPVVEGAPLREPEKPKWSKGKIVLAVVGILAVIAALIALVSLLSKNQKSGSQSSASSSESGEIDEYSRVDMTEMTKYGPFAYTDESLSEKYNAEIAASVGDHELNNALLQIFYWSTVYNDLNENADYLSFRGPDTTRPFADQNYGENVTWEQHYLQTALDYYLQNVALAEEATKNGVTIPEETQEMIDQIPANLAAQASDYGFADVEDYLGQSFGPCVKMQDYLDYYNMTMLAYTYAGQLQENITVTEEEIEEFFDRHAEDYAADGIEKIDQNVVNVRHILVMPLKDTDSDGDGTNDESSAAAWADAEETAKGLYEAWKQNPTEEFFASLATSDSSDTGSTENGGLYEGIYPGQMVTEFNDWCFDPSRQPGDTDIVRTTYGYHIMYFSGQGDYIYWRSLAERDTRYEKFNKVIDDLFSQYELKVNYKKLHLFDIITRANGQDAAAAEEAEAEDGEVLN